MSNIYTDSKFSMNVPNETRPSLTEKGCMTTGMQNDSEVAIKSESESENKKETEANHIAEVTNCTCLLCRMKMVIIDNKCIPWICLCRIFFLSLRSIHPDKEYFSVKTDVPDFIHSHWACLSKLDQFHDSAKWRKSMLDAINHSRYFESGKTLYHVSGYWKLKDTTMPTIENWQSNDKDTLSSEKLSAREKETINSSTILDSIQMSDKKSSLSSSPIEHYHNTHSMRSNHLSFNEKNAMTDNVILKSFYSENISKAENNLKCLYNLYINADKKSRELIQVEIQSLELNVQHFRQMLYEVSDPKCDNYSSSSLLTHVIFTK